MCIESPALVRALKEHFAERPEKTIIPGDDIEVDFTMGTLTWAGQTFRFPPLSRVPQELVVAGGIENLVRRSLAQA